MTLCPKPSCPICQQPRCSSGGTQVPYSIHRNRSHVLSQIQYIKRNSRLEKIKPNLDLLKVESRVDDSSVFCPFITIITKESTDYKVGQRKCMWLWEIINFIEHFLDLLRIRNGYGWYSSSPCKESPSCSRHRDTKPDTFRVDQVLSGPSPLSPRTPILIYLYFYTKFCKALFILFY